MAANTKTTKITADELEDMQTQIAEMAALVYLPVAMEDRKQVEENLEEMRALVETFHKVGKNVRRMFDTYCDDNFSDYVRIVGKAGRKAEEAEEMTKESVLALLTK